MSRENDKALARLIYKEGLIERPPLEEALAELKKAGETGLDRVLVERGQLAREVADRLVATLGEVKEAWRPGSPIGDYVLREKIGRGSMGVVYRCRHALTNAEYAIKALPLSAGGYLVSRFEREGQAQARVDAHPNVVRVHSAGKAGGCLYLVMDLCTGGDLETRLRAGPLAPREGAELVMHLARGLAHVHVRGVLHRDLKPANVLFEQGEPKLVDFGLAKVEEGDGLTKTGDLIGTPTYMAPEQARGKHHDVDARADVYGLGAVLYHVLTGSRPFVGASTIEVVQKVLATAPPRPRSLVPAIPPALEEICMKAMAKLSDMRIQTAKDLGDALEVWLRTDEQPERSSTSPAMKILAVVTVVCVVLGGVGVVVALGRERKAAPQPPVAPPKPIQPAPPPQPARLADLRWELKQGAVARCTVAHTFEIMQPKGEAARWRRRGFRSSFKIGLTWHVLNATPSSTTIEVTIDSLVVRRESIYGLVDYDSERGDAKSPFARALGVRFSFMLDPTTGEVSGAKDVEGVMAAIDRGVREEGLSMRRLLYVTPQLSSGAHLQNFLNSVLRFLPGRPIDLERPWEGDELLVETPEEFARTTNTSGRRWSMERIMGLPLPDEALPLSYEASRLDGGAFRVVWKGSQEQRTVAGRALLEGGRPREIEVKETQRRPMDRGEGSRVIETTVTFGIKGRFR